MFKVNSKDTPKDARRRSGIFVVNVSIVNFEWVTASWVNVS